MQALSKVFFFSGEFFVEGLDYSPRQRCLGFVHRTLPQTQNFLKFLS